ncbi:BamA/TamA family outer membrane protein [Photobacterium sanguinicancri]|uniref:BamA/TamA family outer membrane protein n=1 Tax=Photobacterium sanguinicancri TaxID=875932 RepID=UPI0007886F7D|nr:BamA/TamA family outer membrane protein [Photobacterium sanguinicancri]KXI21413.1 hypothetical protein AS132_22905 [Photobacterium sanguinicancri]
MKHTLALLLAATCSLSVYAEEKELTTYERYQAWLNQMLLELGADGQFNPDKGVDWSVMPGPFYTPEKKFGIGVSAVGLYKPDLADTVTQPSSVTINGFGSINGAYGLSFSNTNYLAHDKYRLFIDAELMDSPDVFYGVGMNAGLNNDRVDYTRRTYAASVKGLLQVMQYTYVGLGIEFSKNEASDAEIEDPQKPWVGQSQAGFPDQQFSAGVTMSLAYDSRDFALNASQGRLVKLDYTHFSASLGSDHEFDRVAVNYSDYYSPDLLDGVIAWQALLEANFGDVSWDQMALLGGGSALRGYEQGHYRDRNMMISQVEYRQPIGGRHGMVYWVGAGTLSDQLSELGQEKWLTTVGVGYRFEIKQRVNLRLDMGFGNGESGFYFAINEAF